MMNGGFGVGREQEGVRIDESVLGGGEWWHWDALCGVEISVGYVGGAWVEEGVCEI